MTNIQTRKYQSTQIMVRALEAAVITIKKFLSKGGSHWRQNPCRTYIIFHIQHHTQQSSFFVRHPFQPAHPEEYSKGTTSEAHRVTGNNSWTVTLDELDKVMGLIVARGVIGEKNLPIKSIWNKSWGCPLFNTTMPRWRFLKIMKFFRFDLKTEKRRNLKEKKFCLA